MDVGCTDLMETHELDLKMEMSYSEIIVKNSLLISKW